MLAHHYLSALRFFPGRRRPLPHELGGHARASGAPRRRRPAARGPAARSPRPHASTPRRWRSGCPRPPTGGASGCSTSAGPGCMPRAGGDDVLGEARDALLAGGRPRERAAEAMELIGELEWMRGDPGAFAHPRQAAEAARRGRRRPTPRRYVLGSLAPVQHDPRPQRGGGGGRRRGAAKWPRNWASPSCGPTSWPAPASPAPGWATPRGSATWRRASRWPWRRTRSRASAVMPTSATRWSRRGELARAFELYERGLGAEAARFGDADRIRWSGVERMYQCYWRGDRGGRPTPWPTASWPRWRLAFQRPTSRTRGWCAVASGWPATTTPGAPARMRHGRSSWESHAGYPEMPWCRALALHARVLEAFGQDSGAATAVDELLAVWPERFPTSYWVADLAFTLHGLGRSQRLLRSSRARPDVQPLARGRAGRRQRRPGPRERRLQRDRLGPRRAACPRGRRASGASRRAAGARPTPSCPSRSPVWLASAPAAGCGRARRCSRRRVDPLARALPEPPAVGIDEEAETPTRQGPQRDGRAATPDYWSPARPSRTGPLRNAHPGRRRASPRCTPCCAAALSV